MPSLLILDARMKYLFALAIVFIEGAVWGGSFEKHCENIDQLTDSQRYFVQQVLDSFDTVDCYVPQRNIDRDGALDLHSRKIVDISLIRSLKNVKRVDLSSNLISDIGSLEKLPSIEVLNLNQNMISDIAPLADFSVLKWLSIKGNLIFDVSSLSGLSGLQRLDLRNNPVFNFESLRNHPELKILRVGLEKNPNSSSCSKARMKSDSLQSIVPTLKKIEVLYADNFDFKDTKAIESAKTLEVVSLNCNKIASSNIAGALPNLRGLSLGNNELSSIGFFTNGASVTYLALHGNFFGSIKVIKTLKELRFLNMSNNRIRGEITLPEMPYLKDLRLANNDISDIVFEKSFDKLITVKIDRNSLTSQIIGRLPESVKFLKINHNSIESLEGVSRLTNLREIHLEGNVVSNLKPLNEINSSNLFVSLGGRSIGDLRAISNSSIKRLFILNSNLKELSSLPDLPDLRILSLERNSFYSIAGLATKYPKLNYLDLSFNKIIDFSELEKLDSLSSLFLSNMQIKDISQLSRLAGVRDLDVSENQISDLSPVAKMTSLKKLYARSNIIRSLDVFENSAIGLKKLDLDNNLIEDASALRRMENLRGRYSVSLWGNPLGNTIQKTEHNCPTKSRSLELNRWCKINQIHELFQ